MVVNRNPFARVLSLPERQQQQQQGGQGPSPFQVMNQMRNHGLMGGQSGAGAAGGAQGGAAGGAAGGGAGGAGGGMMGKFGAVAANPAVWIPAAIIGGSTLLDKKGISSYESQLKGHGMKDLIRSKEAQKVFDKLPGGKIVEKATDWMDRIGRAPLDAIMGLFK